jgi:hypothetical protein
VPGVEVGAVEPQPAPPSTSTSTSATQIDRRVYRRRAGPTVAEAATSGPAVAVIVSSLSRGVSSSFDHTRTGKSPEVQNV